MSKPENASIRPGKPPTKAGTALHYWRLILIGIMLLGSLPYTTAQAAPSLNQSQSLKPLQTEQTDVGSAEEPEKPTRPPAPPRTEEPPEQQVSQPSRNALTGNPITFTNSSAIVINDAAAATPYPASISVAGLTASVNGMTVRLNGITHTFGDDIDVLLVGPGGQKTILMSDISTNSLSNITLIFDDNAGSSLPASGSVISGTYKPTNLSGGACVSTTDTFPDPAPSEPYSVTLSTFSGVNTTGNWQLYVQDDCAVAAGSIARGWDVIFYANQAALGMVGGADQSATISTSFALPLQTIVKDASGNPQSGVVVTFTAPVGGASGTFAGGSNIYVGTTDASGIVTSSAFTANMTAGSYSVVATANGIAIPLSFILTNVAGTATQINVVSGNNQSTASSAAFANRLVAKVTDIGNNPVSGKTVTFTAPNSGASGKFSNGTISYNGTTDSSGTITASTFTANSTLGSYVVTATVAGVANPASFTLTNTTPVIKVSSGSGQSAVISNGFSAPLVALVTTGDNNSPVANATVTFSAPGSGASGKFANGSTTYVGTTNSSGLATSSAFTANGTLGTYNVSATVANAPAPATFVLTNSTQSSIQFAGSSYSVSEGVGTAVITLTRTENNVGLASASIVGSDLTATSADYKLVQNASILDTSFDPGTGTGGTNETYKTIVLTDGKILLAGNFTSYNNQSVGRIARLNSDGSLDTSFASTNAGASGTIHGMTTQPDGKIIIVGGDFANYNGVARNRIARLNSDGTLDTSFTIPGTGPGDSIFRAAVQPDGKIVIVGNFTTYNGATRNKIARLNSDGSLDDTFTTGDGANSTIWALAIQPDGKIVIGGNFTSYAGVSRNYIARLNSNGSLDTSFNPGSGVNSVVWVTMLQPDGKIILGGDFNTYNGVSKNNIARVNTDGSLDTAYPGNGVGANESIRAMDWQSDGKLIIGGNFTTFNQNRVIRVARLNTDGSLDLNFISTGAGPDNLLWTVASQPDNKVVMGGDLTTYDGVSRSHIARAGGTAASWADGDTSPKTISVTITDDGLTENNENLLLTINSVSTSAFIGSPSTATVTIIDNEPVAISAVSGSGQVTATNTTFGQPLVVSLVNSNTNSISGQVVTFTAPASGASGTFANGSNVYTVTSGVNGQASATLTANSISGTYQVVATVAGLANSASFTLTNVIVCNPLIVTSALDNGACGTLRAATNVATNGQTITITLNAGSAINLSSGITLPMGVNLIATAGCANGPTVAIQAAGANAGTGLRLAGNNSVSNVWIRGFSNRQILTLGVGNKLYCVRTAPPIP